MQSGSDQVELQPDEHDAVDCTKTSLEPPAAGPHLSRVCLEAFDRNPVDFFPTVMSLLEGAKEWLRLWNLGLALC